MLLRQHIGGVVLQHQKNVSWFIGGRSHVNTASEPACCVLIITPADCVLISNNIESERLIEEEMGLGNHRNLFTTEVWPWNEPHIKNSLIAKYTEQLDHYKVDGELEAELLQLRTRVDEADEPELMLLGRLAADAMEQTATLIRRGLSEFQIAAELAKQCLERELEPIVNLIAVDERIFTRRHPQPTTMLLDRYAMLVVCGRRNGLIASATRLVHFGPIPADILHRHEAATVIDTKLIHATKPGVSLEHMYSTIPNLYKEAGYPDEYKLHHQGGLTGYSTRERLAVEGERIVVAEGQVYAWNPSIAGAKSEDTIYVKNNSATVITSSNNFPEIEVSVEGKVWKRPAILQRA